jgi:hypothetical protein
MKACLRRNRKREREDQGKNRMMQRGYRGIHEEVMEKETQIEKIKRKEKKQTERKGYVDGKKGRRKMIKRGEKRQKGRLYSHVHRSKEQLCSSGRITL